MACSDRLGATPNATGGTTRTCTPADSNRHAPSTPSAIGAPSMDTASEPETSTGSDEKESPTTSSSGKKLPASEGTNPE